MIDLANLLPDLDDRAKLLAWKGDVSAAEADTRIRTEAACAHGRMAEAAGIPSRLRGMLPTSNLVASAAAYRETDDVRRLIAALDKGARMALLMGPPGTGKSVAAAAVALRELWRHQTTDWASVEHCHGVHWISAYDYCRIADWEDRKLRPYLEARFLVVDDLGEEGSGNRDKVSALITHRYDADKSITVLTTNMTADEFTDPGGRGYHVRIKDRINEIGEVLAFRKRMRGTR